ncbi:MAG: hypothetical protein A2X93_08015 [Deltaproteobacteria bacterium GWC2_56_8]|nr:MAG: hypothetical protein A2X99_06080 [Deltaproteobacteria bacterium GWB2_55_19]OGP37206.1 MAG: hypothetical protein A2X93_08015 [Deltaproteobacteria bacterium GWC2_56_8]HAO92529.1 hypothetical protein [Deltaproteobacteria bacterium]
MGLLSNIVREKRIQFCLPYINKGDRVLEIGCGNMYVTKKLREKGVDVVGLDVTPPADVVGDINRYAELGFKQGQFDVILAFEVIEHVDLIKPVKKLLKPGGLFIATTPVPSMDWVLRIMEFFGLNQKRTSPHSHLVRLEELPFETVRLKKVLGLMQWGVLRSR